MPTFHEKIWEIRDSLWDTCFDLEHLAAAFQVVGNDHMNKKLWDAAHNIRSQLLALQEAMADKSDYDLKQAQEGSAATLLLTRAVLDGRIKIACPQDPPHD